MSNIPLLEIGKKYRHYKRGGTYEVVGIAWHSETDEQLVIYKTLYQDDQFPLGTLWARPVTMFFEEIESGITRFSEVVEMVKD